MKKQHYITVIFSLYRAIRNAHRGARSKEHDEMLNKGGVRENLGAHSNQ